MDCREVREWLATNSRASAAGRAGRASAPPPELAAHLDGCEACRRAAAVEAELTAALDTRLPRHAAPAALRARLEARLAATAPATAAARAAAPAARRGGRRARLGSFALGFAAAAAIALGLRFTPALRPGGARSDGTGDLVAEAVNDHLRVVASTHPVEIESGGIHQVKPWFTGRLEFAPRVAFSGDGDFPLLGGSVGYFRDRRAAVFVFKRRLHTITLLVFPAAGLDFPARGGKTLPGGLDVAERALRGFSVLLWRQEDLGYALVSDVSAPELETLAARVAGG